MGNTPLVERQLQCNTAKESGVGKAEQLGLKWGACGMQGWRHSMEDAHFAVGSLMGQGWDGTSAFGVLDGHGGSAVAEYCADRLPRIIASQPSGNIQNALTSAFHAVDQRVKSEGSVDSFSQGCTAVVALVNPERIVVANAGDSRAVLCRGGWPVALSQDHKPHLRSEVDRIKRAGGYVVHMDNDLGGPRVMGDLNLSRSLGDHRHKTDDTLPPKNQIITAEPDVRTFLRQPNDEFMIIACDGVWDVLSNDDVCQFIRQRLVQQFANAAVPLSKILEDLLDQCVSPDLNRTMGRGGDNMTAVLVAFDKQSVTWSLRHIPAFFGCVA
jgi:protein phosphatase 2C family protein 2/3